MLRNTYPTGYRDQGAFLWGIHIKCNLQAWCRDGTLTLILLAKHARYPGDLKEWKKWINDKDGNEFTVNLGEEFFSTIDLRNVTSGSTQCVYYFGDGRWLRRSSPAVPKPKSNLQRGNISC